MSYDLNVGNEENKQNQIADPNKQDAQENEKINNNVNVEMVKTANKPSYIKYAIICGVLAVIIVAVVLIYDPSVKEFKQVKEECLNIAGEISSGDDYFKIDTYPEHYDNASEYVRIVMVPEHQEKALEAIRYANEKLGFPSAYSLMMNTTALMGRQTEENDKYKVSWSYHPDSGLEATYQRKK